MKRDLLKAIKEKCMDCCCFDRKEVVACPCKECTLWNYRLGKDIKVDSPDKPKRQMSEEQKAKCAAALAAARAAKKSDSK